MGKCIGMACVVALLASACTSGPRGALPASWTERRPPAPLGSALERAAPVPLASLQYRAIGPLSEVTARIEPKSAAVDLPGGRSFVAAFRIDQLPRPLSIQVSSRRSSEPGSVLGWIPDFRQGVFAPVVYVLDAGFNVQSMLPPEGPLPGCLSNGFADVYRVRFAISEPSSKAAFLVIATTGALRAQSGIEVCGITRNGLAPTGDITLAVAPLPMADRVLLQADAELYDGVRHADDRGWLPSAAAGLLLVGEKGLVFAQRRGLETTSSPYVARLDLPYDAVASVQADAGSPLGDRRALTVRYIDPGTRVPRWASIDIVSPVPTGALVDAIVPHLGKHRLHEDVAIRLAPAMPSLEFVQPHGGTFARLGEAAVAGGAVTAWPCSLCITGACTPEILVSCAGLFSVGAVAGAVIGGGYEVVRRVKGARPSSPDLRDTLAPDAMSEQTRRFDSAALRVCIQDALANPDAAVWRVQARSAGARLAEAPAPASVMGRWDARMDVHRIALVAADKPAQPPLEVPVRLLVEGRVVLADNGKELSPSPLKWESAEYPLGQWIGTEPDALAPRELKAACNALAMQAVQAARDRWRE